MIALIQRVVEASVRIGAETVGEIGPGLVALIGVRPEDVADDAVRLVQRVLAYRIFADADGRMNHSLAQACGGLLVVPQFTLAADTGKGLRPGFSTAAAPERGRELFDLFVSAARANHSPVETGVFGAHMHVSLVNDGPATFWLEAHAAARAGLAQN